MIVLAAVLVTAVVLVYTLSVRPRDLPPPEVVSPFQPLDERRAAIYENLRDLQFEFRVGKLSEADYQQAKQVLQKELAGVAAEVEKLKLQLAGKAPAPAAPAPQPAPARSCPHCGASFTQPLKFCGECGKPMREVRR